MALRPLTPEEMAYPRVTEILSSKPKPWLQRWKDKWGALADRKTSAANRIGTAFHQGAEKLVHGEWIETKDKRLHGMLAKFETWIEQAKFVPKETELRVVSNVHRFKGTFDATGCLADKPKTLTLMDWKTSSGLKPDMALQLAAYAIAYEEMTGLPIKRGMIVLVKKQKPFHELIVQEYKLGKRVRNQFLRRLKEYNEARS